MGLTPKQAAEIVNRLYSRLSRRRPSIAKREDYFAGKHPLAFASPEWRKFHEDRFAGFSDNW